MLEKSKEHEIKTSHIMTSSGGHDLNYLPSINLAILKMLIGVGNRIIL